MEQILAWDPEVILTQEAGFAERVRQDPLWRGVSAVRSGRVHCAPVLPFGWLDGPPSVNRLIGVRWLLEKLHPGRPRGKAPSPGAGGARVLCAVLWCPAVAGAVASAAAGGALNAWGWHEVIRYQRRRSKPERSGKPGKRGIKQCLRA
jgi:hypothetical protein